MKQTNYWQQFLRAGRVEDYLSYLKQKPIDEPVHKGEYSGAGSLLFPAQSAGKAPME